MAILGLHLCWPFQVVGDFSSVKNPPLRAEKFNHSPGQVPRGPEKRPSFGVSQVDRGEAGSPKNRPCQAGVVLTCCS